MLLKSKYLLLFLLGFIIIPNKNKSQTNSDYRAIGDAKIAFEFFNSQNYRIAMEEYKLLYRVDSLNVIINHHLAVCYLNTNIDKTRAIPLLEYVTKQSDCNPQAWYDLGRAYRYVYRLDEAIEAFGKFRKLVSNDKNNHISASRQIEMCENAKSLLKTPINIKLENMGISVNSVYPDFNPCITADETELYFSSKREGNLGSFIDYDGYITTDIYYSEYKYDSWNKAKRFSPLINTPYIEECTSISADGELLFFFVANEYAVNDVFYTQKKGRSFQKPLTLGANVNHISSTEYSASVSPDGNYLFFSSDRKGGIGGNDIYYSRRLPSGEWGPANNAGNIINTEYDEDFPYLAPDGKSFYFCSFGHNSMGGYDIFKAEWDQENRKWSKLMNIGYPLNNTSDNMCISFTKSGRHAYVSMFLDDGFGDLDIYRVTFNDIEPPYTILKLEILNSDSSPLIDKDVLYVEVKESGSDRYIGKYLPCKKSGYYTIILLPGIFDLDIKTDELTYFEDIIIHDRGSSKIVNKTITLK